MIGHLLTKWHEVPSLPNLGDLRQRKHTHTHTYIAHYRNTVKASVHKFGIPQGPSRIVQNETGKRKVYFLYVKIHLLK